MSGPFTVTGVLTDDNTVRLDNPLPHCGEKVRVTIELVTEQSRSVTVEAFLTELRSMQSARGHIPREAEQIEDMIRVVRQSWGD